jgi:protein-disulfide isomerase
MELPSIGPADAPVTLVKLSDFECPFCRKYFFQIEKLRKQSGDQVRIMFANHPLSPDCNPMMTDPFHKEACGAAYAGVCAQAQGKFWEMAHELFSNQHALAAGDLRGYARDLGLDMGAFEACMKAPETVRAVENQALFARSIGMAGTPGTIIGAGARGFGFTGGMSLGGLKSLLKDVPTAASAGKVSELTGMQEKALAAGKKAVEPSVRALAEPSEDRMEMVVVLDPADRKSGALLQHMAGLHLVHKNKLRVSFRTVSPKACHTGTGEGCEAARALVCGFNTEEPMAVLVALGRRDGKTVAQVVDETAGNQPKLSECLKGDGPQAALSEDAAVIDKLGEQGVYLDGYHLGPSPSLQELDAMIARVLLMRRTK